MAGVEQELIKASGVDVKKYPKRQELLAAICRAINDLPEEDFEDLSDESANWFAQACKAMNSRKPIADFVAPTAAEDAAAVEAEDDADTTGVADEKAYEGTDDAADGDDAAGDDAAEEAEEAAPVKKGKKAAKEAKPAKEAKATKKASKAAKPEPEAEPDEEAEEEAEELAKPAKAKKGSVADRAQRGAKNKVDPKRYETITGEKDRYGITLGTKTADAVALYEKGATAKDIQDKVGGKHYNVLKRLEKEGHKVEKLEGGIWKLTHVDDVAGKKATTKKGK